MSRYSVEHKVRTRGRILAAADRMMKAQGVEATSVEIVMREAGLTVGGFYAHFPSKEALAHEAMLAGMEASVTTMVAAVGEVTDAKAWVRGLIRTYLAQVDDPDFAHACPLTLLLPEVARGGRDLRNAFAQRTGALLARIAAHFPEVPGMGQRDAALMVYATCIGAVSLARAMPAPEARQRIVATTEAMLVRTLALDVATTCV
jgi:TetR/AcrR family transcriptional repressor of nem operon